MTVGSWCQTHTFVLQCIGSRRSKSRWLALACSECRAALSCGPTELYTLQVTSFVVLTQAAAAQRANRSWRSRINRVFWRGDTTKRCAYHLRPCITYTALRASPVECHRSAKWYNASELCETPIDQSIDFGNFARLEATSLTDTNPKRFDVR